MGLYRLVVGGLFAGMLCLPVWGANEPNPGKSADADAKTPQRADEDADRWNADDEVEQLSNIITLSESQQAKIRKLASDYLREVDRQTRPAVARNLAELRGLDQRIENNRLKGDAEKIRGLHEQQDKLMGSDQMQLALDKLLSDVKAVVPAEKEKVSALGKIFAERWDADQRVERMTQELNLTPAQQDKIAELITGYRDEMFRHFGAALGSNQEKVRDISKKRKDAAGDEETLQKLRAELREALDNDERDVAYEKLTSDIEKVLTAKQKSQFREMTSAACNWLPFAETFFPQSAWLKAHPEALNSAVQSLKLPPARQAKIDAILGAARLKAEAVSGDKPEMVRGPAIYEKVMAELKPFERSMVKAWQPAPAKSHAPAAK